MKAPITLYVWLRGEWRFYADAFDTMQEALAVAHAQLAMGRPIKINLDGQAD
jgi:hypothetical protein